MGATWVELVVWCCAVRCCAPWNGPPPRTFSSGSCLSSAASGPRSGRVATSLRISASGWRASRARASAGVWRFRASGCTSSSAKHCSTTAGDRAQVPSTNHVLRDPLDGSLASTASGSSTQSREARPPRRRDLPRCRHTGCGNLRRRADRRRRRDCGAGPDLLLIHRHTGSDFQWSLPLREAAVDGAASAANAMRITSYSQATEPPRAVGSRA